MNVEKVTFDAQVNEWISKCEKRMEAVFKLATQELFFGVLTPMSQGGRMRIDTGFLRASFRASLDAPILLNLERPKEGVFETDTGYIALTINQAKVGQTIFGMFTANYAYFREYGTKTQAADGFVSTNVNIWQQFVNEAAETVRAAL